MLNSMQLYLLPSDVALQDAERAESPSCMKAMVLSRKASMSTVTPGRLGRQSRTRSVSMELCALKSRLQTARRRESASIGGTIAAAMAVGMICLALCATADLFLELATVWRAAWVMGVAVVLTAVIAMGCRRWIVAYTLSDTAADAERRLRQFGQRLRTTLDYDQQIPEPAAASPSLLASLHNDTRKLAEETEWSDAVDSRPLFRSLVVHQRWWWPGSQRYRAAGISNAAAGDPDSSRLRRSSIRLDVNDSPCEVWSSAHVAEAADRSAWAAGGTGSGEWTIVDLIRRCRQKLPSGKWARGFTGEAYCSGRACG